MGHPSTASCELILDKLRKNMGQVVTYAELGREVNVLDARKGSRGYWKIAQIVSRLRTMIAPQGYQIHAVRLQGYVLVQYASKPPEPVVYPTSAALRAEECQDSSDR